MFFSECSKKISADPVSLQISETLEAVGELDALHGMNCG